jgi:hypothetical protein
MTKVTDSDKNMTTGQREEIEITPEMIEAGAEIIWNRCSDGFAWGAGPAKDVAELVFREMLYLHPTLKSNYLQNENN